MRSIVRFLGLAGAIALMPAAAFAQDSGIAGTVRDSSGAVLPGVTVEASSPALIEKTRAATTDGNGQYSITSLRPGTYTVAFSLTGFTTVRREGIELRAAFTAPVSVDMRVGALEESVTVSGASPVVDMRNTVRGQVANSEVIETLPTAKNWSTVAVLTVGVRSNQSDVGGSSGEHQNQVAAHGGAFTDRIVQVEGLYLTNLACAYSCTGLSANDASTEEIATETAAISAEVSSGGVRMNIIPKEGGNRLAGSGFGNFATSKMQGSNLTDLRRKQGVTQPDSLDKLYDTNFALGGPIKQDKLWFFTAHRYWGYGLYRTDAYYELPGKENDFVYDPDLNNRAIDEQENFSHDVRLTWNISSKHKLSGYFNLAPRSTEHWNLSATAKPGTSQLQRVNPNTFSTITFRSTMTGRLLFESGFANNVSDWTREPIQDMPGSFGYPVVDDALGIWLRAYPAQYSHNLVHVRSYKNALSYVTGTHSIKVGMNLQEGWGREPNWMNHDTVLRVFNGAPYRITVYSTPYTPETSFMDLGIYAQDKWTIKRATLNLGVRYDNLTNDTFVFAAPAGRWVPERNFDQKLENVPNWKDVSPRLGIVYDLFGNSRTAVRATLSRYVAATTVATGRANNPIATSVISTTRNWTDSNNDGLPQESELAGLANLNFGKQNPNALKYNPDYNQGWHRRSFNWEFSAGVQHEVMRSTSVDVSYYRRSFGNFTFTDNLRVDHSDYDPFCMTAPSDSRLPNGGGYQICGLYDLNPAKFGQSENYFTYVEDLGGKRSQVFNGVDISFAARPRRGLFLQGGVDVGETVTDDCEAQFDNPSQVHCRVGTSWLPRVRMSGSYSLPWDIQVSGVLQNLPGAQITASWQVNNAQAATYGSTLGRGFSLGSHVVPLIEPGTVFEARRNQVDLRAMKSLNIGGNRRLRLMFDLYNALNSDAPVGNSAQSGEPPSPFILSYSTAAQASVPGGNWLRPVNLLQARFFKLGAQLNF